MKKKLQIFISSTYTDLSVERQAAVQAVLRSGNIPAGMELFSAGNKNQLDTIKKWIDESDVYMLILGGRYGSLEPESQLSYTEIEYRYALDTGKPLFAIVISDSMIEHKVKSEGQRMIELDNQEKYKRFKELVLSKVCRICNDEGEIKLSILESTIDIQNQFELIGWIKGNDIPDYSILIGEIEVLRKERDDLQNKVNTLGALNASASRNKFIGDYTYEEILSVLTSKIIIIPEKFLSDPKIDFESNALKLLIANMGILTGGITMVFINEKNRFLIDELVPLLLIFGMVERQNIVNSGMKTNYDRFVLSPLGNKFLSIYQIENLEK